MNRATSKGNEAKTKQPSDMPTPRFEHGGSDLWSNTLLLDHEGALHNKMILDQTNYTKGKLHIIFK